METQQSATAQYQTTFEFAEDDRLLSEPHLKYRFLVLFNARCVIEGSTERTVEIEIVGYELDEVSIWPDKDQGWSVRSETPEMAEALVDWFTAKVAKRPLLKGCIGATCLAEYERREEE